jgi:hypothetical protein
MQGALMDFATGLFVLVTVAFGPAVVGVLAWVAY